MLFRIDPDSKKVSALEQTDLVSQGFLETKDLEEWLVSSGNILGRRLLWIARQDRASDEDRSDLLAIDNDAELLVVELKRGYVDMSVFTQAFNYASHYAMLTQDELLERFLENSTHTTQTPLHVRVATDLEARQKFADLTGASEVNESQVLVLIGASFDPRVLGMCDYLNRAVGSDGTISAECWKVALFQDGDSHFLQVVQILPTPDLQFQIEELREERRANRYKRDENRIRFMNKFKESARSRGLVISAKRGQSYECSITPENKSPIRVSIRKNLTLYIPKCGYYGAELLEQDNVIDNGSSLEYSFSPFSWADDNAQESTLRDLLSKVEGILADNLTSSFTRPDAEISRYPDASSGG
jgi:hypothetical protein